VASAVQRIKVSTGYEPREHQNQVHQALKRFNVLVAHRRFGKTVLCVNELVDRALRCKLKDPRFAYVAPLRNQAKDVAWEYLKAYTRMIPGYEANEAELRVDLPGGRRIRLYGADNPDQLRGLYLDGVVFDEFAQMQPRIWGEVVRPALADRNGVAIFIGTPMGRNAFHKLYEDAKTEDGWKAMMFRASETGIVPQAELDAAARAMTAEQYAQEFECSFEAAIVGAYYGKEMALADKEKRITSVPWEPRVPVTTAWDLGAVNMAIWFVQQVGNEVRVIDFIGRDEVTPLSFYAGEIMERKQRGWAFAEHLLPHDAEIPEQGTGKSRVEVLDGLGIKVRVLPRGGSTIVEDGINAAKMLLPRCWFDATKCKDGIEALRQYRTEWDDKKKVFSTIPRHDWASHPADAFRYLAMGLKPASKTAFDRKIDYGNVKVA
jgi:hypothetical protein